MGYHSFHQVKFLNVRMSLLLGRNVSVPIVIKFNDLMSVILGDLTFPAEWANLDYVFRRKIL